MRNGKRSEVEVQVVWCAGRGVTSDEIPDRCDWVDNGLEANGRLVTLWPFGPSPESAGVDRCDPGPGIRSRTVGLNDYSQSIRPRRDSRETVERCQKMGERPRNSSKCASNK